MLSGLKPKLDFKRFFVGEGRHKAPYLLTHRRVYILPTKQGLGFVLLLFIMLLGSINYSNSLGYFLTFLLASLFVVTMHHTHSNLLHLSIGSAICKPVFAGCNSHFNVKVDNSNYLSRYSITTFTSENIKSTTDIDEKSLSALNVEHVFLKRGLNSLPRFTIESTFPFGLFRAWTFIELDQEILVYPKPSDHSHLPTQSHGFSEGNKLVDIGADDFRGLRSYVAGDPLQHIHWKSFARHHTMQTKEFSSTSSDELWLNLDDSQAFSIEQKLSQLTRWVILAEQQNLSYGLNLNSVIIQPNSGQNHLDACLKQLALYGSDYA